jgi:hypothetical protein
VQRELSQQATPSGALRGLLLPPVPRTACARIYGFFAFIRRASLSCA